METVHDDQQKLELAGGFEHAHEEWLRQGGLRFVNKYTNDPAFYLTKYWMLVRDAVLKRDRFICYRCSGTANQVHHLNYRHKCQEHLNRADLVSICRDCHGFVEYVRIAEKIQSKLRLRKKTIEKYIAGIAGYEDETPLKGLSRLVEQRELLLRIQDLFRSNIPYTAGGKKSVVQNLRTDFAVRQANYEAEAANILGRIRGGESEQAKEVICMIERSEKECEAFIGDVMRPVQQKLAIGI